MAAPIDDPPPNSSAVPADPGTGHPPHGEIRQSGPAAVDEVAPLPRAPGAWPLLGHAPALLRDPLKFLSSLPAHGDLVRITLGPVDAVVVCRLDLARQMIGDERVFDKDGALWRRVREVEGDGGLVCARRAEHRPLRRLAQPAFQRTRLPGYATIFGRYLAHVADSWRDGQILDVPTAALQISCEAMTRTLFPASTSRRSLAEIRQALPAMVRGIFRRMITPPPLDRLPTPANRAYHRTERRLHDITTQAVRDYRSAGLNRGDMLSVLLANSPTVDSPTPSGTGRPRTDRELGELVASLFLAGAETTSAALSWALHLLAEHLDVQDRVADESRRVLGGRAAAGEDLPQLRYASAVVSETLRLYPPAWLLTRHTTADTHLGGHHLAAGTTIIYSPYLIHRLPAHYPDPDTFRPERFLTPSGAPKPPSPKNFLAFGDGARRCIGDQFATIELILALATITGRWHLHPVPGRQVRPLARTALHPHHLSLRLSRRDDPLPARP
ncbi:cytochrome P450 [Nonomuraea sp. NPDC051941]|uniref:cytochrome P450 n=1 Tax=Nonomuraea sp. NPDC051941 TaxID=3364373 RepID=UPI0037C68635